MFHKAIKQLKTSRIVLVKTILSEHYDNTHHRMLSDATYMQKISNHVAVLEKDIPVPNK